jgi:uncharacterized membrane protein YraQ (UPF0718 family)
LSSGAKSGIVIGMGKEKRQKKQTTFKENLGKLMLDLGKLVFGGMFIAGILRGELPHTIIIMGGLALAIVGFVLGLVWTTKEQKTIENKE